MRDSQVIAIRDRVNATVDKNLHEDQTRVAIRLKSGRTVEKFVEHAIGSLDRPMSDGDLEAKFRGLAKGILAAAQCDRLMELCWGVAKLADAGDVAARQCRKPRRFQRFAKRKLEPVRRHAPGRDTSLVLE